MKKILLIDSGETVEDYISPIIKELSSDAAVQRFPKDLFALETKECEPDEVCLIHFEGTEDRTLVEKILSSYDCQTFLAIDYSLATDECKNDLKELCKMSEISGWFDLSLSRELNKPVINHLASNIPSRGQLIELANMGKGLQELTAQTVKELTRLKKLHEKLVPLRKEEEKGMTVYSKYAAGESSGGEFFNFLKGDGEFLFLLSSTNSYLLTSSILSRFEPLSAYSTFSDERMREFVTGVLTDVEALDIRDNKARRALDLCIAKVDLNKMQLTGYKFGGGEIYSTTEKNHISPNELPYDTEFFEQASFSLPLNRDEKLIFLSSGVRNNSNGIIDSREVDQYITSQFGEAPHDLLNDLFFQLKRERESEFLKFDASAIYIEVDRNVMYQI